jgi:hypothetical protein
MIYQMENIHHPKKQKGKNHTNHSAAARLLGMHPDIGLPDPDPMSTTARVTRQAFKSSQRGSPAAEGCDTTRGGKACDATKRGTVPNLFTPSVSLAANWQFERK